MLGLLVAEFRGEMTLIRRRMLKDGRVKQPQDPSIFDVRDAPTRLG